MANSILDQPADIYSAAAFIGRVRERFASRADILKAIGGDQILNPAFQEQMETREFKAAAVLIPIIVRGDSASVLLTQRTEFLNTHKGQIAFPGGKLDEGETGEQAALREAWEEVGLVPDQFDVLGTFGTYYSGSGFAIEPVIGVFKGNRS